MTTLSDREILHQAAADIRKLPAVEVGTAFDAITRWCRDDPGRVRALVGGLVRYAAGGKSDASVAFDAVVAEGPHALAYLLDRYAVDTR